MFMTYVTYDMLLLENVGDLKFVMAVFHQH